MAERQSIKKVDAELKLAGVYKATFVSGAVVQFDIRSITHPPEFAGFDFDKLPPIIQRLAVHGMTQKLDDSAAGEDEPEAIEEIGATAEMLAKGEWTSRVAGDGIEGGIFARAWMQVKGVSLADAKAAIGALVASNHAANVEALKAAGNTKEAEKLTEKQVFVAIRKAALARNPELAAAYKALQDKRSTRKAEKAGLVVDGV